MSAAGFRKAARGLSIPILGFWGLFLGASLLGDAARGSRPLVWGDYLILTALVMSLAGLAAAWKWELAGALATLAGVALGATVNWRVLIFPGTLIPITACLFLVAFLNEASRREIKHGEARRLKQPPQHRVPGGHQRLL